MKKTKRLACLLLALLMAASLGTAAFAAGSLKEVYTSQNVAAAGDYYFDMDSGALRDYLREARHNEKLSAGAAEADAASYADAEAVKDLARFKEAKWYLDKETYALSVAWPSGYDPSAIFSPGDPEDVTMMLSLLRLARADSVAWQRVTVPMTASEIDDYAHHQLYIDMQSAYDHYMAEMYAIISSNPGSMIAYTEDEITQACVDYARGKIAEIQACEYFFNPGDELFKLKKISTNDDGSKKTEYFPYEAMMTGAYDESSLVIERHDYYWCEWNWTDSEHAIAEILCYYGQQDGENDKLVIELTGDAIVREVLSEASELTDGSVRCTATVKYEDMVFTDTRVFDIPATGDPERLTITEQPADASVAYPAGTSFHVAVDKPENVASYQWLLTDSARTFTLDGLTATTDTLVLNSTERDTPDVEISCVITDINGNRTYSKPALLHINNSSEEKMVLYVGDYALVPGYTLDLSKTTLGSGVVTYDADGVNMTFDNVKISSDGVSMDNSLGPTGGIFFSARPWSSQEYFMHFLGDCVVDNKFFDESINSGGVVLNGYFACGNDNPNRPTLIIDGNLTLKGGSDSIYTDSHLEIAGSLKTESLYKNFCRGLVSYSIFISEGATVDISSVGPGIYARGDLFIEDGATVSIDATPQHISIGNTESKAILATGNMTCGDADVTVSVHADPELFIPYGSAIAQMDGVYCCGTLSLKGTRLTVVMDAPKAGRDYIGGARGVSGDPLRAVSLEDGARLNVSLDSEAFPIAEGIATDSFNAGGRIVVEEGCRLDVDVRAAGVAIGVDVSMPVSVKNASVDVHTASSEGDFTFGLMAPDISIDVSDYRYGVSLAAEKGIALFASNETFDKYQFDPAYEPELIKLAGKAAILTPEGGVFSPCGFELNGGLMPGETVFDPAQPAAPASTVKIGAAYEGGSESVFTDVPADAWYAEYVNYAAAKGLMNGVGDGKFDPAGKTTRGMLVTILYRLEGEPAVTAANSFADVAQGQWYTDAVIWASSKGIVNGYGDGNFGPTDTITREQFAVILYRYAGFKGRDTSKAADLSGYEDAEAISSFAVSAMKWANAEKLINGATATTLLPGNTASRAETATILMRFIEGVK
ncbi:MAG: S-layer homology domain-containing protein [Oscillospiraceae bacterium]|nr:S-layer homology domain-containing protein [Oscillospiraceae bacterium]